MERGAWWATVHEVASLIYVCVCIYIYMGFPHSSVGKSSAYNAGGPGSIPGLRRSPGEGNGNPLRYSCLENPMDRGAWQATVLWITRVQHVHHLITKVIYYISRLCLPLDSTFHEGRGFCLFSSWMYPRSQDSA